MASFVRPEVGMVTCPYRGDRGEYAGIKAGNPSASALNFIPGVLVARHIEHGIHFALGSNPCRFPQSSGSIGGLEPLVDYLADDYELGFRISQGGL